MPELTNAKTLDELVSEQALAIQSKSTRLIDMTIGSVLRAFVEAVSGVALWIQSLVVETLLKSRAATATAGDLDSWMADYELIRLQAINATGSVTLTRLTVTPLSPATIIPATPVPAQFETSVGNIRFQVIIDTTHPHWSNSGGGYRLDQGVSTIEVPVQAVVAGKSGNVAANTIDSAVTPLTGIDVISNDESFLNGRNEETDEAFRKRFRAYISSLSKATRDAVGFAVSSVRQDVLYSIVENVDYISPSETNPPLNPGYFFVVIDDGSGEPGDELIAACADAIEATRGFTIAYAVYPVSVVEADISAVIEAEQGYMHSDLQTTVRNAIQDYVNLLAIGEPLRFTKLAERIYASSAGVRNVTGLEINSNTEAEDLEITIKQIIKTDDVAITVVP